MARYDVNAANTNRIVRFRVEAEVVGDGDSSLFRILKGQANAYPHYEQHEGAVTANQELGQLRTNYVSRALSVYAVLVGISLVDDSHGTGGVTATTGPALMLEFEQDQMGVFFNQSWPTDVAGEDKHITTDINDTVGTGGMPNGPKTKDGLQSLLDNLATVSFDGGTTGPFGSLSSTGNIVLPDGRTTSGAPTLAGGSNSGLTVTYVS